MAKINPGMLHPSGTAYTPISKNNISKTPVSTTKTSSSSKKTSQSAKNDALSKEYGRLVSVSEDGDTVRIKSEEYVSRVDSEKDKKNPETAANATDSDKEQNVSLSNSKDTTEPADEEIAEKEPEVKEEKPEQKITSFAGYTSSQLKLLVQTGAISEYAYESEIEAREARTEALTEDTKDFINDITAETALKEDISKTSDVIKDIENGKVNDDISIKARMQAMEAIDNLFSS